jgi:type I restriction enzyme S subunit
MVVYPTDWKESCLNDVIKIKRGASPRPIESYLTFSSSGVRWIKIGDAPRDGKYIVSTAEKITQDGAKHSVRVYPGDFILSNSMSFGRPYLLSIDGCIHDGWLRLYDFQDEVDKDFLYYLLSSTSVQEQYSSFAAGSGVQNLNKEVVKKVKVFLPSYPEQQAIASVLSDFDEHINNLTKLIEKKKAIRDGALEDLVSGRTRIKGFDKQWETVSFDLLDSV